MYELQSRQCLFQNAGFVDQDRNGTGEFGWLRELSGAVSPRGGKAPIDPLLWGGIWSQDEDGSHVANVDGYRYYLYLPMGEGDLAREDLSSTGHLSDRAVSRQEVFWLAFGVPSHIGVSGEHILVAGPGSTVFGSRVDTDDPLSSAFEQGQWPPIVIEWPVSLPPSDGRTWRSMDLR
jgi:hypothetical protein